MYKDNTLGVVVPAYNEEGQVGEVIETIPEYVDRVYVVDDCSTDGTWEEIRMTAKRVNQDNRAAVVGDGGRMLQNSVVPISHDENRGVGGAIKTGYLHALDDDMDVVAVMGGDGQMDPDVLASIVDPVAESKADYAKGNRFLHKNSRENVPPFRLFGNTVLSFLTKISSGYWSLSDSQNGYSAISGQTLKEIDIENMYEFYGYCNDLLVKLNVADTVIADVAAPIIYDDEESSIELHSYVPRVSTMLLRNMFWRLKEKYVLKEFHPLVLLYGLGLVCSAVAIFQLLAILGSRESNDDSSVVASFLLGTVYLVLGMRFDKLDNDDLTVQIY